MLARRPYLFHHRSDNQVTNATVQHAGSERELEYDNSVINMALDATFYITWQLADVPVRAEWPTDLLCPQTLEQSIHGCPQSLAPDVISR